MFGIDTMIDWNIRLGDILVMVSLACTIIVYAFKAGTFTQSIMGLKGDMADLKKTQKEITDILVQVAVQQTRLDNQNERMNQIDRRIDDLRHNFTVARKAE